MTLQLSPMMDRAAKASFADLDTIIGTGGLVALAPHPDDESLGCGALLRAAASAGRSVAVVVVSDGRRSHPASHNVSPDALARIRALEIRAALVTLHPNIFLIELGYCDGEVPFSLPTASFAIADLAKGIGATALVASWDGDPHCDHAATAALARRVHRLSPELRLWSYPIWGRFAPTQTKAPARIVRFDTMPNRAAKAAAIACHRSQMTDLIDDDPEGFTMTTEMQTHFINHPEVFFAG
ncbi:MAG: PIG-L family deacetylase [Rhodobacteraceae bacterium]|nr:MAG: PIG-L family deacetylase [Paracoccaceae bacterium]